MARRRRLRSIDIRGLAGVSRRGLINHLRTKGEMMSQDFRAWLMQEGRWAYGESAEIQAFAHAAWLAGAEAERKRIANDLGDIIIDKIYKHFSSSRAENTANQDQLGATIKTTIDMDTQQARSEQL